MLNRCRLTIFFVLSSYHVLAQKEWELKTERDGIKVYQKGVQDSKIKALKVICEYASTPAIILAVLMDVENGTEWIYHTKSCKLIRQVSPLELYYYSEVSLPWPVENRDFVAHLTATVDRRSNVVTVNGPVVPDYVPEKKGIVRIHHSKGKWTITPIEKKMSRVEYTLQVDPGGNLPAWLVNMFAAEGPIQSFKKLKDMVNKPKYQQAD
jgi:hypothetical protein